VQVPEQPMRGETDKKIKVTCFSFGQWKHFSTDCKEPRLCFMCQTYDHVGKECPEWSKPLVLAQ
jgi:hypothetical protein